MFMLSADRLADKAPADDPTPSRNRATRLGGGPHAHSAASHAHECKQMIEVFVASVQRQVVLQNKGASHMSFVGIGVPCFLS